MTLPTPSLICFSVVRKDALRQVLGRGTVLSLIGFVPLLLGAILLPAQTLQGLGVILFGFFLLCVVFGLLPYKRLSKKQLHPDSFYLEDSHLTYVLNGYIKKNIPVEEILSSHYVAHSANNYGIELTLKKPNPDFFLPYFTQNSAELLQEQLEEARE